MSFPNVDIPIEIPLIKNPFACKISGVDNRFFYRHQDSSKTGNTDYANFFEDINDNISINNELDPMTNYVIGKD